MYLLLLLNICVLVFFNFILSWYCFLFKVWLIGVDSLLSFVFLIILFLFCYFFGWIKFEFRLWLLIFFFMVRLLFWNSCFVLWYRKYLKWIVICLEIFFCKYFWLFLGIKFRLMVLIVLYLLSLECNVIYWLCKLFFKWINLMFMVMNKECRSLFILFDCLLINCYLYLCLLKLLLLRCLLSNLMFLVGSNLKVFLCILLKVNVLLILLLMK